MKKLKIATLHFLVFGVWGVPATLTLFAIRLKKCCSVLQYKVKTQGVGAVTKPIVATIITPCIFACITPYDSQAIARYMS